jgi:phage tail protein X
MAEIIKEYVAKNNDRIDAISYRFYGSSEYVNDIYAENPYLLAKGSLLLSAGDVVLLPKIIASTLSQKDNFNLWVRN